MENKRGQRRKIRDVQLNDWKTQKENWTPPPNLVCQRDRELSDPGPGFISVATRRRR